MTLNEIKIIQDLSYKFSFNEDFATVWSILRDVAKVNEISNRIEDSYTSKPVFTKMKKSYETDALFNFSVSKSIKLFSHTTDVIQTNNYNKINWRVYKIESGEPYLPPYNIKFELVKHFNKTKSDINNNSQTCIFTQEITYDEPIKLTSAQIESQKNKYNIFCNKIRELIKEEKYKIHNGSISINKSAEFIWKSICDLKNICKYFPSICNEIRYKDDTLKEGLKFKFIFYNKDENKENRIKYELPVTVNSIINSKNSKKLVIETLKNYINIPRQFIIFKISLKKSEKNSKLTVSNIFKEIQGDSYLKTLSDIKKISLEEFKFNMECL